MSELHPSLEELYAKFQQSSGICTDTRKLTPGCLFVALKGGNFNGNAFAVKAIEGGASWAIVDEALYANHPNCLLVEDGLETLQDLARFHRLRFDIPFIGITGSNGKTTTKELLAAALRMKYKVHVTPGNFNNHIGLPLTVLSMPADAEVAVLEMGANHEGENADLCAIFLPTHGLITSIGKEHLEGFGSLEGVVRANSELFEFLRQHSGTAFVNLDDPALVNMANRLPGAVTYALDASRNPHHTLSILNLNPSLELASKAGQRYRSSLFGKYNASNVLATYAVALTLGVSEKDIAEAVANYIPSNNRSQWVNTLKNAVLLDCYNANPSSMELAITNFNEAGYERPVYLVGDMFEMGGYEDEEHQAIIRLLENVHGDVWLAGKAFSRQALPSRFKVFSDTESLKQALTQADLSGCHLLVKASRGMAFENLLEAL